MIKILFRKPRRCGIPYTQIRTPEARTRTGVARSHLLFVLFLRQFSDLRHLEMLGADVWNGRCVWNVDVVGDQLGDGSCDGQARCEEVTVGEWLASFLSGRKSRFDDSSDDRQITLYLFPVPPLIFPLRVRFYETLEIISFRLTYALLSTGRNTSESIAIQFTRYSSTVLMIHTLFCSSRPDPRKFPS